MLKLNNVQCTFKGLRVILVVVHTGRSSENKIYVAAMEALRKNER
jgi:hypothetical protein